MLAKLALVLPLFLVACGKDDGADDTAPEDTGPPDCEERWSYLDADGDGWGDDEGAVLGCEPPSGWVDQGGDCDDADPAVHPEAEEQCDGRDDDCDGVPDEGALVEWFLDTDGDGYGDPESLVESCTCPGSGWVRAGGDCDETDPAVNPGATEVCDGDDDDCDGRPDQGAVSTWYDDSDGDGWGDDAVATETCDPTPDQVSVPGDCDPTDASVHPEAEESCNEVDDDCDGEVDEGFDLDGDGWLDSACTYLEQVDCDDDDPDIHPLQAEICDDGIDQDCDGWDSFCTFSGTYYLRDAQAWRWSTESDGDAGRLVRTADLDQDGYGDLLTSSLYRNSGEGGAWVSHGPLGGDAPLSDDGFFLSGSASAGGAGHSLAAGDVDGDGDLDVGVGCPWGNVPGLYLVYSPISASMVLDAADVVLYGSVSSEVGDGSDLADLDRDGFADAMLGSAVAERETGVVWVVYGPLLSDADASSAASFTMTGEASSSQFGLVLDGGGDVDGDGLGDLLIAAPRTEGVGYHAGAAYLVLGAPTGSFTAADAEAKFTGETAAAAAGNALAMADVSGDGYDDVIIGAWGTQIEGSVHGGAYVAFGPIEGTMSLGDVDIAIYGDADTAFASALDGGDIDQDGRADLLVGAYWADGVDQNSGNAYLFYAPTVGIWSYMDAAAVLQGANEDDAAGQGVALGDIDGDSRGDLIVGACYEDTGASQAGSVYVTFPEIW